MYLKILVSLSYSVCSLLILTTNLIAAEAPEAAAQRLVRQKDWKSVDELAKKTQSLAVLTALVHPIPKMGVPGRKDEDYNPENADLARAVVSLVENPAMTPELLRALYSKGTPHFHNANAWGSNENWPADVLIQLALSYSQSTLTFEETKKVGQRNVAFWEKIKKDAQTEKPSELLAIMLAGPVFYMRDAAVSNRFTPPEALAQYYRWGLTQKKDSADPDFRENLIKNSATPLATKLQIVQDTPRADLDGVMHAALNCQLPDTAVFQAALKRIQGRKDREFGLYEQYLRQALKK